MNGFCFDFEGNLPELKTCPFCGRKPGIYQDIRYPLPECEPMKAYEVFCNTIGCPVYKADNTYFKTPLEAAEKWNRRRDDG